MARATDCHSDAGRRAAVFLQPLLPLVGGCGCFTPPKRDPPRRPPRGGRACVQPPRKFCEVFLKYTSEQEQELDGRHLVAIA